MPASRRIFRHSFLFAIFILLPSSLLAQGSAEATVEFAEKIVSSAHPRRSVSFTARNISSMSAADFSRLRGSLEGELRKRGLRLTPSDTEPEVQATLSENIRGYLWVARIRIEDKAEVVMVPFTRPAESDAASRESVRIEKKLIWQQPAPILDVDFFDDAQGRVTGFVVLEPEKVALYSIAESGARLRATLPIVPVEERHGSTALTTGGVPVALPRDPRGKVQVEGSDFRVSMDRIECSGTAVEPPHLDCRLQEQGASMFLHVTRGWTVGARFVAGRNYFEPRPEEAADLPKAPPFYSLAAISADETDWWIVAATDGHTRLLREDGSVAAELPGWGSHVAGITSGCGANWQVVGTRAGDSTEPDAVQVFEIRDGNAVAVSSPAELPGPVTALWATESGSEATLVVYNLKSKNYEAYTLSFVCRH